MKPDDPWGSLPAWTRGAEIAWEVPKERYRKVVELGRGGMGVVAAVEDRWLDRNVALKRPIRTEDSGRVMREAAITSSLNHPCIPPIFDVGEDEEGGFYTLPILDGRTLDGAVQDGLTAREGARILSRCAAAVAHAHHRGIVHRDLKPQNILVGERGEVWVVDWGVAWTQSAPDEDVVGTPGFMAPEQANGQCSPSSDVFGLGKTLEAVAAQDPELLSIVARSTSDPRYSSVEAFADELMRWLNGEPVEAHTYGLRVRVRRWIRARALELAAGGAVALVAGISLMAFGAVQMRATKRVEAALADALAVQARDAGDEGRRRQAEWVAAQSLMLKDTPAARGELVRWAGRPAPVRVAVGDLGCTDAILLRQGRWYCVNERAVHSSEGVLLRHEPSAHWSAKGHQARWDQGVLTLSPPGRRFSPKELSIGPPGKRYVVSRGPAFAYSMDLDLVDPNGTTWPSICPNQVISIYADDDRVLVGCRDSVQVVQGDDRQTSALGQSVAVVAWAGEIVLGTQDGWIVFENGYKLRTEGQAPVRMLPMPNRRMAVLMESGRLRVLDVVKKSWIAELPSGADDIAVVGEQVRWAKGQRWEDFSLPEGSAASTLDLSKLGGVACMSYANGELVMGSSNGAVDTWGPDGGEHRSIVEKGARVTKSVVHRPNGALWVSNGAVSDAQTGHLWFNAYVPFITPWEGGMMAIGYGRTLRLINPGFEDRVFTMPNLIEDSVRTDNGVWMLDKAGGVHHWKEGEAKPNLVFSAPGTGVLAVDSERVYLLGAGLEVYSTSGDFLWKRPLSEDPMVVTANTKWIIVGGRKGSVLVLSLDGEILATFRPHVRRVSTMELVGDVLYTASWDGWVRRFGLAPLEQTPSQILMNLRSTWGGERPALDPG